MNRCTVCRQLVSGSASADHQRMHSLAKNHQQAKRHQKMVNRRGYEVISSGHKISVKTGEVFTEQGFFSRIWQMFCQFFGQGVRTASVARGNNPSFM